MASLKYQIAHMDIDRTKLYRSEQHDKDGNVLKPAEISTQTERMYLHHAIKFGEYCKTHFGCRTPEECSGHLQEYADYLVRQGLSAGTVHTYLSGPCRYWGIPLADIAKPCRVVAQNTRSRGQKAVDQRSDAQRGASPRLYDFASKVGIRRSEYMRLRGTDLVRDEAGQICVRVTRGKGGKAQLQRVLPEDIEMVASYFNGSDDYIFDQVEMRNKIDLHRLRAVCAQRAYAYYLDGIKDAAFRARLIEELKARWESTNNKVRWRPELIVGNYFIRGENRVLAHKNGLPLSYNRLAVMAVSIFHLSHFRCDVTIDNYLLTT